MLGNIKNAIKYTDFLAESPKMRIQYQNTYKTFIGGVMSISLFILTILAIGYFGKEIWVKAEPTVIISAKDFKEVGPFKQGTNDFNIFLGVEYQNYTFYHNPKIYQFKAVETVINYVNGIQKISYNELEIDLCRKYYNNSNEMTNTSAIINLDLFHCIKPNSAQIQGRFGTDNMHMISIYLNKCNNNTNSLKNCLPQERIDKALTGGIIGMYVTSYVMVMNNNTNPIQRTTFAYLNSLNVDLTYSCFFFLNSLEFINDSGFLLENLETTNVYQFNSPSYLYYGQRGDLIVDIEIEGNNQGQRVNRYYAKIQDVLTRIGGILKFFSILTSFIAQYSCKIEYVNDSINNIKYRSYCHNKIKNELHEHYSKKNLSTINNRRKIREEEKELEKQEIKREMEIDEKDEKNQENLSQEKEDNENNLQNVSQKQILVNKSVLFISLNKASNNNNNNNNKNNNNNNNNNQESQVPIVPKNNNSSEKILFNNLIRKKENNNHIKNSSQEKKKQEDIESNRNNSSKYINKNNNNLADLAIKKSKMENSINNSNTGNYAKGYFNNFNIEPQKILNIKNRLNSNSNNYYSSFWKKTYYYLISVFCSIIKAKHPIVVDSKKLEKIQAYSLSIETIMENQFKLETLFTIVLRNLLNNKIQDNINNNNNPEYFSENYFSLVNQHLQITLDRLYLKKLLDEDSLDKESSEILTLTKNEHQELMNLL